MTRKLCLLAALFLTLTAGAQPEQGGALALVGGRVYAAPDAVPLDDAAVVIEAGRIVAVGPRQKVSIPPAAQSLDCKGLVIVAGFQNSHVHFTDPARWGGAASAPAPQLEDALRYMLTQYGFTTVVDTASDPTNTRALRHRIDSGEVNGPRILTAGAALYPPNGVPYYVREDVPPEVVKLLPQPVDAQQASDIVRAELSSGTDIVKLFTGSWVERGRVLPMPLPVASAAVHEAHTRRKLVFAHPSNVAGLEVALRSGVDVLAHAVEDLDGFTDAHRKQIKASGIAMVPTLRLYRGLSEILDEVRDFARDGGDILFGTDVGYLPNFDHGDEYELMAAAGLGWREILASLTTTPAKRFGEASRRGRVAPGMTGDLVVLAADPIFGVRALSRTRYTIRGGKIIYSANESGDPTTVNELKEMQQRLVRAIMTRQRDEYAAMLAPEWRVTHINGRVMTKAEVLAIVFSTPDPPFAEAAEDDVDVRLLGDNAAVVTGRSSFTFRDGSRVVLRFTDVVHRRDGRWVVVASHASPLQ